MSAPTRAARTRVVAVCVAALMVTAAFLGGATPHERGMEGTWTDATWSDGKSGNGAFTALQLGGIRSFVCTAGLWTAATVTWARPTGTPNGVVSYRVTVQRAGTSQTTTQTATTYTYSRPALNFDDVTLTVQPVIGQWTGPSQSMFLDAVPLVGMRCP